MAVHHVRKLTDFLFNVLSGECCSEYVATFAFVKLITSASFDGGKCVDPGKTLLAHLLITVPCISLVRGKYGDKYLCGNSPH
jgi:hypothetical protein